VRIFIASLGRTTGRVATIVFVAISVVVVLSAAAVVASLVGRVERLESDLGTAQTKIVQLTASLSRLSANVDTADRSIKSLRSDLDHPRVRPLTSTLDVAARPPQ
jgi:predicted PurR-regulated permease PerM